MAFKKKSRPSAAVKNSSRRYDSRNRPQVNKPQLMNKEQAKMPFPSQGVNYQKLKPLARLFGRGGMSYGRRSILRTVRNDNQLRCKFLNLGILTRKGVEQALLELLFQSRNLKDWDAGGDDLVDVFRLIKGRVKWAAECSVDLVMQLFFALLRGRLDCSGSLRTENCCKVALRVDKVIAVSIVEKSYLPLSNPSIIFPFYLPAHLAVSCGSLQGKPWPCNVLFDLDFPGKVLRQ
ncbi:hypothetical protein diail_10736 [Diaporthe ilicicola]|nr:hypothetical protein diail_10736 [Diaporthe ilicicola]